MAKPGIRRIRTAFDVKPKVDSKQTRIRIPQPITRPFNIRGKDVIQNEYLRQSPWWYTLHKRGLKREKVGMDYLESRAISRSQVKGTLPERIVYLYLITKLHMKAGVDFTFQSSLDGGRLSLGGIVADFKFDLLKIILNPHGPTHEQFLQMRKDEEQRMILEDMGFKVFDLTDTQIYNIAIFEDRMRRVFTMDRSEYSQEHLADEYPNPDPVWLGDLLNGVTGLVNQAGAIV